MRSVIRSAIAAGLLVIGMMPAGARDCRPADPPPGVRVKIPAGCEARKPEPPEAPSSRLCRPDAIRDSSISGMAPACELAGVSGRTRFSTVRLLTRFEDLELHGSDSHLLHR